MWNKSFQQELFVVFCATVSITETCNMLWLLPPGEFSAWHPLFYSFFASFIHSQHHCKTHITASRGKKKTTKEIKNSNFQWFVQSTLRLIPENMLSQVVFHNSYLNFSFILGRVQQGHFEGGGFKSLGAFLGRFEVFVWGHLL